MNELPRLLFSNVAVMELIGFNARQIEEGLTKRGDAHRTTKKKQGPLSPQSLADNISKLSREQMERLFNQMVHALVAWGLLDGGHIVALDGSKLETPKSYQGCGKLKQTRSVKVQGQKERAIQEYYMKFYRQWRHSFAKKTWLQAQITQGKAGEFLVLDG